jgi:peptide/nickel transport system substrate-binding protein
LKEGRKEIQMEKKHTLLWFFSLVIVLSLVLSSCQPATPAAPTSSPPRATNEASQPTETANPPAATTAPTQAPALPPTVAPTQSSQENVAVYASSTTYPNLDPSASVSNENIVLANVYELLVYSTPPGSSEILRPGLATKWESNADGTLWTFHLRDGVKFHDGTDLTADIVKRSIERTKALGQGFAYIWDPVDTITAMDKLTVQFKLKYPAALDLIAASTYASWIFNPDDIKDNSSDWFNSGHDAGTGPYTIESYAIGQNMVLKKFDAFWGGWKPGQIDKVVFQVVEDPVVRQQMIESGDADVTLKLPRENYASLANNPDIKVESHPSLQNLLALFNTKKPPLNNVLVRQALSYTFPYDQVVNNIMEGYATQAHGPVPVGLWGGHSKTVEQYNYDLTKAKELLTQAGLGNGGFTLQLTYATGDLDEQQIAELWKAELAKLNITLNAQPMAWEAQWALAKTGLTDPNKAQDILVWYWWPDVLTPYSMLHGQFHCGADIVYNMAYYCNTALDNIMDEAAKQTAIDRTKAGQMFLEAENMLVKDAVALYIYDVQTTLVFRSNLKGFVDNPAYAEVVFFYELAK